MRIPCDSDAGRELPESLAGLLAEACEERRRILRLMRSTDSPRATVAGMLVKALAGRLPKRVNVGRYLTRLGSLTQMSVSTIGVMMSDTTSGRLPAEWTRCLAHAFVDLLHFAASGGSEERRVKVQYAIALQNGRLVVAVAVLRMNSPVGRASGVRALLRASAITRFLGGQFQRGVDDGRVVIGLTFDLTAERIGGGPALGPTKSN